MKVDSMDFYGSIKVERLDSLPVWDPSYVGRLIYNTADNTLYVGKATSFEAAGGSSGSAIGIRDTYRNLVASNSGNYIVNLTASEVILQTVAGVPYLASSVSISPDIRVSGVNGLDTGSRAVGNVYYLYIIYNGATVAGLFSLSATSPTMPSGYTYKALVSSVFYHYGAAFSTFSQVDNKVAHGEAELVSSGMEQTYTALTMVSVPTNAKLVTGFMTISGLSGETWGQGWVASNSDGLASQYISSYRTEVGTIHGYTTSFRLPILVSRTIYYKVQYSGNGCVLNVKISGFEF